MSFFEFVFPAHAGMNRESSLPRSSAGSVPRSCGDEPMLSEINRSRLRCSPLMRG